MTPRLPDSAPPPNDEVEAVAAQYLARLQAGEAADRRAVARAHPHLGPRLERRLALVEMTWQLGLVPQPEQPALAETVEVPLAAAPDAVDSRAETTPAFAPPTSPRPRPSDFPDYEILRELGRGGMGVVYQARQKSLNRLVALKMIRAGSHAGPDLLARFYVEAEALASLQHPNIVQVYVVDEFDGCPCMAMEYLDGGGLDKLLAGKPQPPAAAAALVETLARAMHAAHLRGIVHRDLKPANVLLQKIHHEGTKGTKEEQRADSVPSLCLGGELFLPKITDFGLAKRLAGGQAQTSTGVIMGTPCYMAPEQAEGRSRDIGPATDVYALGAILYELLTGRPPFLGESEITTLRRVVYDEPEAPSRLGPRVPRDLETICLKCLEKEPGRRYASAEALADDLRRFLGGEPIAARPPALLERAWKWTKRRPALAALFTFIALAIVVSLSYVLWSNARLRRERDRADARSAEARRAVNTMYTRVAEEWLADEPQHGTLQEDFLKEALAFYTRLAAEEGDTPEVRREVALAHFRMGQIYRVFSRVPESEEAYQKAIAQQEALRAAEPGDPRHRHDLAESHIWYGELLRKTGQRIDDAEHQFNQAREQYAGLTDEFPGPLARFGLARSYYNLGILKMDTSRPQDADQDFGQAIRWLVLLCEPVPAEAESRFRHELARACINRGILRRDADRPKDAEIDDRQAIDLLEGLLRVRRRADYRYDLAVALHNLGNLKSEQKELPEAKLLLERAWDLLRQLVADFHDRPDYKKKLAKTCNSLASVLFALGDRAGAADNWERSREALAALVKESPAVPDYQAQLGIALGNLGWLRTKAEAWAEARPLLEEAVGRLRTALKPNPKHPDYRNAIRNQWQNLAEACVRLGDHAAAVEAALALAAVFPERALDSYYAACYVSRSVPLAEKDTRLAEPERRAKARQYRDQAAALLRETVGRAGSGLARLADEKDIFRPLEGHAEFEKARRDLDAVVKPVMP